jgi:hypothetical protein
VSGKVFLNTGVDFSAEWADLRRAYKRNDTRAHKIRVFEMALSPCLRTPLEKQDEYQEILRKYPLPNDDESLSYDAFRAYVLAFQMLMREDNIISFSSGIANPDEENLDRLKEFFGGK